MQVRSPVSDSLPEFFWGEKNMWKKCILCVISVNAHNVVIVSRL